MAINWFPGHMNSTRQAIQDRVKAGLDVVIELLDARLPGSSANPLLASLTDSRPTLKVLNKQDMAEPARTEAWLAHYNALPETRAIGLDASVAAPARALIQACRALAPPTRGGLDKPLRVLICGIPNVGKSTLINTLVGRKAAKTGDEPGITKTEQKIVLENGFYLFDTPGMLWPRIEVAQCGYHLAASGAIGRNAFDEEEVALELLATLRRHYPARLLERYGLKELPATDDAVLTAIGARRGAREKGGVINLHKAGELLLSEFRAGLLGRITLETPEEILAWRAAAQQEQARRDADRAAAKQAERLKRSGRRIDAGDAAPGDPTCG